MKLTIHFVIAAILIAGAGWVLHAQDTDTEPTRGKVLLLRGGHVMEGEIEKIGTQMRVKNGTSEIWISAEKAARLCADWNDAYVFLQSKLKLDDANERVKLARWCHMNRLSAKALEQAKYALELQPGHPDAVQIVTTLERAMKEPAPKPATVAPPSSGPIRPKETLHLVDVATETQLTFAAKVQPILMNTCANCHCTGRGGKLALDRVANSTQKAATQRNLAKVLTYIDLERPAISMLLERAITTHGGAEKAPIHNRDARAFQTMQDWIEETIARNPHLKDYAAVGRTPVAAKPPVFANPGPVAVSSTFGVGTTPETSAPKKNEEPRGPDESRPLPAKDAPMPPNVQPNNVTPPAADDPFSPAPFNHAYHPKR